MAPFTFNFIFGFNWSIRLVTEVLFRVVLDTSMDLFVSNLLVETVHLLLCQPIHLPI